MSSEHSENGTEGTVFIREFYHKLFVVLRYGDKEVLKALPIGVRKWSESRRSDEIASIIHQLMLMSGVEKITAADDEIDESLH